MKITIISIFVVSAGLAAMPADAVPYLLAMIAIVLIGGAPIVVPTALIVHFISRKIARRKASREFAAAYDAYKRAENDPYADATAIENWLIRCHNKLKSIKP